MNKILSVVIVGFFAANAYATDLPAASTAKKVEAVKHTAAPAKKVSLLKKSAIKLQAAKPATSATTAAIPAAK